MNDVVHAFDTHTKGSRDVSYRLVSHESVGGTGAAFEEGRRDPERNTSRERERESNPLSSSARMLCNVSLTLERSTTRVHVT